MSGISVLTAHPTAAHSPDTAKLLGTKPKFPTEQKQTRAAASLYAIIVFRAVGPATPMRLGALKKTKAMM